eukprot:TRINITY_DN9048_c0_g1_i2.p1 TRINITY_DN9048_c0_g1~~TRINITY_DN9048_c0_g1_i2.p1  ORF type:complete len:123 (+),score=5.73 TRINITY_DN9048_c0_g1_i2:45-413(+)
MCIRDRVSTQSTGEELSNDQILDCIMTKLRRMYPCYPRSSKKILNPLKFYVSRWSQDKYAHGAFSYPKPGSSSDDFEALSAPLQSRVFFAGEHTHSRFPGTVQGAFSSGFREANRIRRIYNL